MTDKASETVARATAADVAERRTKILRLALVVVGAGLAASVFSLWSSPARTELGRAIDAAVDADPRQVAVGIEVTDGETTGRVKVETLRAGNDTETVFFAFDEEPAEGGDDSSGQTLRQVDGLLHLRTDATGAWVPVDTVAAVDLNAGTPTAVALDHDLIGWAGEDLVEIAGLKGFEVAADGRHEATVTVAELRILDPLPPNLAPLTAPAAGFIADDEVKLTVEVVNDEATAMTARATNEDGTIIVVTTTFSRPDAGTIIDAP